MSDTMEDCPNPFCVDGTHVSKLTGARWPCPNRCDNGKVKVSDDE